MKTCPIPNAGRLAFGRHTGWFLTGLTAAAALTLPAQASDKRSAPAPAPHAAAPHFGGAPGGAHMPGSMGGGAHMPGSMGGAAHIPGSMGGGAHLPGSMGHAAEGPHRAQGETAMSGRGESHAHAEPHRTQSEASAHHQGGAAPHEAHEGQARVAHAGDHGAEHGGDHGGERGGEHGDPRIGGRAALHTRLAAGAAIGVGAGLAAHHVGAGGFGHDGAGHDFRARPADRDVGRDRAFASAHAHDFHARFVRDFTPGEFGRWRGGLWSAGWHFGRFGWWWDVDGVWYPYAVPIFPFPLEVSAITVYGDDYIEVPAMVAAPAIPPLPAAPTALYSCAAPAGYYPAVPACGQAWQMAETAPAMPPN
jgi:hypothetical protein